VPFCAVFGAMTCLTTEPPCPNAIPLIDNSSNSVNSSNSRAFAMLDWILDTIFELLGSKYGVREIETLITLRT
jgi:hypothetical protein